LSAGFRDLTGRVAAQRGRGLAFLLALAALTASALWWARQGEEKPQPIAQTLALEPPEQVRREAIVPETPTPAPQPTSGASAALSDPKPTKAERRPEKATASAPAARALRPAAEKKTPEKKVEKPAAAKPEPTAPTRIDSKPSPGPVKSVAPVKMFAPQPTYPAEAQGRGEEGTVVVAGTIDTKGSISEARVVRGISAALDRAALEAFRTWQFEPATENGQPVDFKYSVGIQFTLDRPRAGEPLPYGGDFTPPTRQASPMPSYPQAAWVAGVRGDVKLQLVVDDKGRVSDIQVLAGLPHGLTEAAVEAVKGWRFKPAQKDGKTVAVYHQVSLRFTP
jgi:protein TonB